MRKFFACLFLWGCIFPVIYAVAGTGTATGTATGTGTVAATSGVAQRLPSPSAGAAPQAGVYHVDIQRGDDGNSGSAAEPWASLEKARRTLKGPATVMVHPGTYPRFEEYKNPGRKGYLKFKAAPGSKPRVLGITLTYGDPTDSYLSFHGFDIYSEDSLRIVEVRDAQKVELLHSEIHSDHWARGPNDGVYGINLMDSRDVRIERNKFYEVYRGVLVRNSHEVAIRHNYISVKGASAILYMSGSSNGLIEYNHITGETFTPYPQDPLAVDKPHQSMIAISSNDLVVRGNIMHGIGNSSGVMLYYLGNKREKGMAYRNILFEGNAIYDPINRYAFRIYHLGENIVLRNNFFYANKREGDCDGGSADARYRYNVAIAVHSIADGYDGSGLELYNNIFLGAAMFPEEVTEQGNVFWSLQLGKDWQRQAFSKRSEVIVGDFMGCGRHPKLMEDGSFFAVQNDLSFPTASLMDLTLSRNSLARRLLVPEQLPQAFPGAVEDSGFLQAPIPRDSVAMPSIGPWQRAHDAARPAAQR
ncbi:hypothetical protein Maes01_02100 [Microbulbifer aestuariivivens]|uniref:Right handed beta helix domain-containing protein n=1 Tax=Microbulbifer aestuariivivens TaxID=1908308 RepID=A0ABP9WQQ0_9GAMM